MKLKHGKIISHLIVLLSYTVPDFTSLEKKCQVNEAINPEDRLDKEDPPSSVSVKSICSF